MRISRIALGLLLAGSLPILFLAGACGGKSGSSGGGAKGLVDSAKGDQLAHQALLNPGDLPGSGWTVSKTDQFDDSGTGLNTAACKEIDAKQQEAKTKSDASQTGRAERELSNEASSQIATSVETVVRVFRDASTPADVLKMFQDALKSSNFANCLKDVISNSAGQGTKVDVKSASPSTSAPEGGTVLAYDFSISYQGQSLSVRYETYLWRLANTGVSVTVNGAKDDVKPDLVKAAVSKTESNLSSLPRQ